MAQGIVNRVVPSSAFALGVVRSIVHGTFLISVLFTSFSALGSLPATILRPTGVMKLLPWSFYDQLQSPSGSLILKTVIVLSLLFSTAGFLTTISTKTSFLLVLFYQGLLRSFGHFNHDEMLPVYYLAVLAFTPCADAFSVDGLLRKFLEKNFSRKGAKAQSAAALRSVSAQAQARMNKGTTSEARQRFAPLRLCLRKIYLGSPTRPSFAYAYPILLMQLLMAWVYFSSALIKLRVAGLKYLSLDNLPALAIFHSLDNLHDTSFKLAFWLPVVKAYLPFAVGLVLVWEVLFPLAIIWRRTRWWLLGFGVVFHLATLFLMNIFFPHQLAMYLIFVDWDNLHAASKERFSLIRRSENRT